MTRKRKERGARETHEILAGMRAWRKMHPQATFVEIETELEGRIKGLREQVLGEIIEMSAATQGQGMRCPACGAAMEGRGKHKRKLQGAGGSEVELEREYLECPACGAGFFPLG